MNRMNPGMTGMLGGHGQQTMFGQQPQNDIATVINQHSQFLSKLGGFAESSNGRITALEEAVKFITANMGAVSQNFTHQTHQQQQDPNSYERSFNGPGSSNNNQKQQSPAKSYNNDYRAANIEEEEEVMEAPQYTPEKVEEVTKELLLEPIDRSNHESIEDFLDGTLDVSTSIKQIDALRLVSDFNEITLESVLEEEAKTYGGFVGTFAIINEDSYLSEEIVNTDLMVAPEVIHRTLSRLISSTTSLEELNYLITIDKIITERFNDFIEANLIKIKIDSFANDYEDVIDNIKTYIKPDVAKKFFTDFNLLLQSTVRGTFKSAIDNGLAKEGKLPLFMLADVVYLDNYSFMLGLHNNGIGFDNSTLVSSETGLGKVLISFIKNIARKVINGKRSIYLITKDSKTFKLTYGELGVFVSKVSSIY